MKEKNQKRTINKEDRKEIMKHFFYSPIIFSNKSRLLRNLKSEYVLIALLGKHNVFIEFEDYDAFYYIYKKNNSIIIQRSVFGTEQHTNTIFNGKNNIYLSIYSKNKFFPKKEIIKLNNNESYFLNIFKYELKYYDKEKHTKIVHTLNNVLTKTFDFVFFNIYDFEDIIQIFDIFYYYNDYEISEEQIARIFLEESFCFAWAFSSTTAINMFNYKLEKKYNINNMGLIKAFEKNNENLVNYYIGRFIDLINYYNENNIEFSHDIISFIAELNYSINHYDCIIHPAYMHELKVMYSLMLKKTNNRNNKDFFVNCLNEKQYKKYMKIYNNLGNGGNNV